MSLKRKDSRRDRKEDKNWEKRMGSGGITQIINKTKMRERDYTDEALALLNHIKLLMKLSRALISALNTELKHLKKPLLSVLNFNLLRAG